MNFSRNSSKKTARKVQQMWTIKNLVQKLHEQRKLKDGSSHKKGGKII
jgi:hypothetical protein